ncbi:hypothetical protein CKO44_01465 [Rubrivivax gelatinosus]|uniref:Hotdog family 3-hydroxylacyl-ACP dehydratase n=1 Tax=Rubrivivax gelatinosus TaxID=28068 RepID=A0ABS1DMG4_RUBGE|nr:hypothetical protein [Rubrivivax gelatinosus]MBK1612137.1 hypothetical protein [Rubrivivax gelatinosus]MBK1711193.1 hypothetical protein [Rubrivivax gelatinosus]
METRIEGTAVEAWVPHRGEMRLLDRLLELDDQHALAEVDVPLDGLFVQDGGVPAWVGLEYMAQTVAAWAGARARRAGGQPRIGFLLGSRRYSARCGAFAAGSTLRISVRCELVADNGLGQFDCRITTPDGEELASALVSVYETAPEAPPGGAAPAAR